MKLFLLTISILLLAIACKKAELAIVEQQYNELNYDLVQKYVIENFKKEEQKEQYFCVYDNIWIEEDSFYIKKYIIAYLEAIDKDLNSEYANTLPLLLVIDKENNKIIRHLLYSTNDSELYSLSKDFPPDILRKMLDSDPMIMMYKNNKMHEEVLIHAREYYNISDNDE